MRRNVFLTKQNGDLKASIMSVRDKWGKIGSTEAYLEQSSVFFFFPPVEKGKLVINSNLGGVTQNCESQFSQNSLIASRK